MKLADTSCLICVFGEIKKPFILMDWMKSGHRIVITKQVFDELQGRADTKSKVNPEIEKGNIKVENVIGDKEIVDFQGKNPRLGKGEISVILFALKLNEQKKKCYAVIDEKKGRGVAEKLGVNLTGTFGLLKTLRSKGFINESCFNECKEAMEKSTTFRLKT